MHEFPTPWRDNPLDGIPDVPAPDPADLDLTIARSESEPTGDIPHEVPIVASDNRGARVRPQEPAEADSSEPAAEDKQEEWTERTVGKYRVIERVQDRGKGDVVESIRHARDTASFPTESPLTRHEKRLIRRIHDAVDLIAEDVGVDALHRIPSVRHYHAFDTPEAYDQAAKNHYAPRVWSR